MQRLEQLLALLGLARGVYGKWILHRMISGAIVVAGLTIILTMMVSALLVTGLIGLYFGLVSYGFAPLVAFAIVFGVLLLIVIGLLITIIKHVRKLKAVFHLSPSSGGSDTVLGSFVQGFTQGHNRR